MVKWTSDLDLSQATFYYVALLGKTLSSQRKKSYLQIVEINSLVSNGWIFHQFSTKKLFKILMAGVYVLTMSRSS